jgi:hypothetical protein
LIQSSDVHAVHIRDILVEKDVVASRHVDPRFDTSGDETAGLGHGMPYRPGPLLVA